MVPIPVALNDLTPIDFKQTKFSKHNAKYSFSLILPCPKYSMIAPVPPDTVKMPATFKIISLGDAHLYFFLKQKKNFRLIFNNFNLLFFIFYYPFNSPVKRTPITFGAFNSPKIKFIFF